MGGGCFHTLRWCAHLGTSRTHRHTLCLNPLTTKREQLSHPRRGPRDFPGEAVTTPLAGKGWVSGALLPPPHRRGAAVPVAQMCGARREATAEGFLRPPPPPARALSCPSPPGSQPEPSSCALLPTPSLSPSCLWGGAGQLGNSCKARVGAGLGCPLKQPETVSMSRWGAGGHRRAKPEGSSAPPPLPQSIWPGQLRAR